ncbi:MAG: 50S ribosomal protein L17 [Bacteroidia bacterium]|nr:50S ribosomal protein L17 [Bacteroidia bacterium]
MRHGNKVNKLGRTASHRKAMLSNMTNSLILHKRITTTVAKAKALRVYAEPLLTKSKNDTTHSRRTVFSYLRDKEALKELFGVIAEKIATRPGGYTRILKVGTRAGDNAEMAMIELVDFNELNPSFGKKKADAKSKTRRAGKKKEGAVATAEVPEITADTEGDAVLAEKPKRTKKEKTEDDAPAAE